MALFGIDIDRWNGDLSFTALKAAGVRFAMLKATQGHALFSGRYLYADGKFEQNIKGLSAVGIAAGAYHIFTASTKAEAIQEAEYFLHTVSLYRDRIALYLACFVRVEGNRYLDALSREELSELVAIFCERLEAEGFRPCLSMRTNELRERVDLSKLPFPICQTDFGSGGIVKRPLDAGERLAIHRYADDGQLLGVPGSFGMNFGYTPLARLLIKHHTSLDDAAIAYILRHPTGDEMLLKLADKISAKSLHPIKDASTEKRASLIRYHSMLSFFEAEHLHAHPDSRDLIDALYLGMLRR